MFFKREKKIYVQSESRTMFFTCEKNDTSNQSQRCVSFAPKFPPFIGTCSLQRPRFASASQTVNEKSFSRTKVKNISDIGVE